MLTGGKSSAWPPRISLPIGWLRIRPVNASQRGMVVGGIWLIGVGAVFLARQVMDLPWGQAWPLFVILAGVASAASSLIALSGRRQSAWTLAWALSVPMAITLVGMLLFADLANLIDIDAFDLLAQWWPVLLIGLGVLVLIGAVLPRQRGVDDRLSLPSAGLTRGEVVLKFGAGELQVGAGSPGRFVEGTFEGGVIRRDHGPGRIELETDMAQVWPWFGERMHWRIGLAPDLPIDLRLEGGASKATLELAELQVTQLTVKTGASSTRIVLPRTVERCSVRIEAGAAQVTVEVPQGVAATIRSQMGLGSSSVDEGRFPRTAHGWESPDYATAAHRADIHVSGGVGSVRIG